MGVSGPPVMKPSQHTRHHVTFEEWSKNTSKIPQKIRLKPHFDAGEGRAATTAAALSLLCLKSCADGRKFHL